MKTVITATQILTLSIPMMIQLNHIREMQVHSTVKQAFLEVLLHLGWNLTFLHGFQGELESVFLTKEVRLSSKELYAEFTIARSRIL